jgi:hypothetical protein
MATGFKSLSANKPALFVVLILLAALTFTTCQLVLAKTSADAYVSGVKKVSSASGRANCPAGYRVSGGGFDLPTSTSSTFTNELVLVTTDYSIDYSKPSPTGQAWVAVANRVVTSYYKSGKIRVSRGTTTSVIVFALCVK